MSAKERLRLYKLIGVMLMGLGLPWQVFIIYSGYMSGFFSVGLWWGSGSVGDENAFVYGGEMLGGPVDRATVFLLATMGVLVFGIVSAALLLLSERKSYLKGDGEEFFHFFSHAAPLLSAGTYFTLSFMAGMDIFGYVNMGDMRVISAPFLGWFAMFYFGLVFSREWAQAYVKKDGKGRKKDASLPEGVRSGIETVLASGDGGGKTKGSGGKRPIPLSEFQKLR